MVVEYMDRKGWRNAVRERDPNKDLCAASRRGECVLHSGTDRKTYVRGGRNYSGALIHTMAGAQAASLVFAMDGPDRAQGTRGPGATLSAHR